MIGAHTLALTKHGRVYSWGYGAATGTGTTSDVLKPTLVTKYYGFASNNSKYLETNGVDEVQGWGQINRKGKWLTKAIGSGGARAGRSTPDREAASAAPRTSPRRTPPPPRSSRGLRTAAGSRGRARPRP